MGGNSTKATSGINGAGTQTQQDHGIVDSAKIFFDDTKRSVRILWIFIYTALICLSWVT
jgi:succinate dehydrogenase/fumarate reductase flavoprotein subunit